jgi:electron transport complex protein RnfB
MIEAEAVVVIAVLGTVFGIGLAYASRKFEVHVDPRVEKISELLPGANCSACGFPACMELAESVVKDHYLINNCKACAEESWLEICDILGIELEKRKQEIALVACSYDSVDKFEYEGISGVSFHGRVQGV